MYEIIKHFSKYHFQTLKCNENTHVYFVCIYMYIQEIATKALKLLPSNHQWIIKHFLIFKFLKLAEKLSLLAVFWTTSFNYILIIVCIYTCTF